MKITLTPWTAVIAGAAAAWTLDNGQVIQQYLQTQAQRRQALALLS